MSDLFTPAPREITRAEREAEALRATIRTCRKAAEVFRAMKLFDFERDATKRVETANRNLELITS